MTNNITPIGSRKSAKNNTPEQPVTKPAPKPTKKSARSEKPHVEPQTESTLINDIRAVDQASIQPDTTVQDRLNCLYTLADYADKLPDGVSLPEPPDGYERCSECGLPTPIGGNGLCSLHDVKTLTIDEPIEQPQAQQPAGAEETIEPTAAEPSEPTPRAERVFSPVQIRKLAREKAWGWMRKHNMPMVASTRSEDEGYTLATDDIGGTVGRVLVGYHAPQMEDSEKRRQFAAVQLNKVGLLLHADGFRVEMTTLDGEPILTIPTTRVPGKADEKPAKREPQGGKQVRWSLPLVTDGEIQGSGI